MSDIKKIHSEVYNLLSRQRNIQSTLYFTFRRSNRDNKLDQGYWFYGNEEYLAVSFWTGMDWKNKTPNIIFVILVDSGETYLEVNTSDSDEKRNFIVQHIVEPLKLEAIGQRYRKHYDGTKYLLSLQAFLSSDKIEIDRIIESHAESFFGKKDQKIGFINSTDFEEQKIKIDKYRAKLGQEIASTPVIQIERPSKLREFTIDNYGPIKHVEILDIPFSSQWIFFTGENGTGKTSILRSLATTLCSRKITPEEHSPDGNFKTLIELYSSENETISLSHSESNFFSGIDLFVSGFAAYGQSRLRTNLSNIDIEESNIVANDSLYLSLFNDDSYLIDLQSQFEKWGNDNDTLKGFNKRKDYIKEILIDVLPNLYDIIFEDKIDNVLTTSYIEKDNDNNEFRKVSYSKLASGLKSMVAMIGDILVRLYDQQPHIYDPSEFTGIILIDEIDIHLHPKLQKQIVQQLTKTFPKIQFIVSTHSPIPFLGAPKNSQIFRVERKSKEGVKVKRLDELLELGDLLPNTILTSPIFGLNDIIPESHDQKKLVRTEITYSDLEFNDKVQEKISAFITDEKEQELIDLFKSRRK